MMLQQYIYITIITILDNTVNKVKLLFFYCSFFNINIMNDDRWELIRRGFLNEKIYTYFTDNFDFYNV